MFPIRSILLLLRHIYTPTVRDEVLNRRLRICDGSDGHNADEMEEHNKQIDQKMRNNGYMKAMDSYRKGTWANSFRVDGPESMRRIFGTVNITEGEECWLRFKNLTANPDQEFSFDYIELVPVSVIQAGEDRH